MPILEDYYRILQVHFLAEPEVIESAYKRLAKKYHPDVNKATGADSRMKKINEAYETLRDPEKRSAYDSQHVKRPPMPQSGRNDMQPPKKDEDIVCPIGARDVLIQYFDCIKKGDFTSAYELITADDKKNISAGDFIKWQSGVSKIFTLQEYGFKADRIEPNIRINGRIFSKAVEFSVSTIEQNTVMGRIENDTILKKVVLEDNVWRVYIGFEDIRPYITRFEELSGLLAAKSAINDIVEHYSYKDSGTGLYNRKGFSEAAQREIWRFGRYGNVFSVILLEVDLCKEAVRAKTHDLRQHTAEWAGKILNESFRRLDILGRWGETGFIVLLPETDLSGCIKAAQKIKNIFEVQDLIYNKKPQDFKLNIGIEEFRGSLEDLIRNLKNYIAIAEKSKRSSIVCAFGIFE